MSSEMPSRDWVAAFSWPVVLLQPFGLLVVCRKAGPVEHFPCRQWPGSARDLPERGLAFWQKASVSVGITAQPSAWAGNGGAGRARLAEAGALRQLSVGLRWTKQPALASVPIARHLFLSIADARDEQLRHLSPRHCCFSDHFWMCHCLSNVSKLVPAALSRERDRLLSSCLGGGLPCWALWIVLVTVFFSAGRTVLQGAPWRNVGQQ